jgi:acetyltransferase-like isoleucine patch superfamily enzyme
MFYSTKELKNLGFKKIGKNCQISKNIFIYSPNIQIGNNVRIDDHVTLKGKIILKNNVHLAKGCTLSGGSKGIFLDDFAAVSNFVQFFTMSDDYYSSHVPAATLNKKNIKKYSKIYNKNIYLGKNVLIGSMSVILPGAYIDDYSSVGAFSLIHSKIGKGLCYSNQNKIKIKKRNVNSMKAKMIKINKNLENM